MKPVKLPAAVYVDTHQHLRQLAAQWARQPMLAVDTESNSLYAYREQVCLIQISTNEADYIIDPLAIDDLQPLAPLMADPQIASKVPTAEVEDPQLEHLYDRTAQILAIGFWGSIAVIVAGLLVALVRGEGINDTTYNLTYGRDIAKLDFLGYTANDFQITKANWELGLLGLLLTPLAYVIAALLTFLRQRDWLFIAVCAVLILLFAAAIALALF